MYMGCILCTYSLPISVFYSNLVSLYVNLQFVIFTHIHNISSLYISVYRLYICLFFNFLKLKTPSQERNFPAIKPDFEFGFPVHFRHVYQCISDAYNWYTASSTSADYFQHCISTCSSTYPSIYQFWRGWTTREWRFEPLRLNEKVQRDGLKFMRTRGEFSMQ